MAQDYLKILDLLCFDDELFIKEFMKTLKWLSISDYYEVKEWMVINHYSNKYPDLYKMVA